MKKESNFYIYNKRLALEVKFLYNKIDLTVKLTHLKKSLISPT